MRCWEIAGNENSAGKEKYTHTHTHKQTNKQTHIHTQTNKQTYTHKHTNTHTGMHMEMYIGRGKNIETDHLWPMRYKVGEISEKLGYLCGVEIDLTA
jgi:hypothetical protein